MTRRKAILLGSALLLAGLIATALLEPAGVVPGLVRGERFYRGRPSSYWARKVSGAGPAAGEARDSLRAGGADAVPVWRDLLRRPDASPKRLAAEELGKLGPDAAPAVPDLLPLLQEDEASRRAAAEALGAIGRADSEVVAALTAALRDDSAAVRRAVAWALGQLGPPAAAAAPALRALSEDPDREVRVAARNAVLRVRPLRLGP